MRSLPTRLSPYAIAALLLGPLAAGSAGAADALLVVDQVSPLNSEDAIRKSTFESWGHTVTLIDAGDSLSAFDTTVAASDIAYVSENASAFQTGTKLRGATIGVVNEQHQIDPDMGFATVDGAESFGTAVSVIDSSHAITSDLSTGSLTIYASSEPISGLDGTLAGGR